MGDETPQSTIDALLREQIRTLGADLDRRLTDTDRNINRRLDQQDRALGEIKAQTTATNGRVTALEKARERAQGVMSAYRWVPAALTAILTTGLTILVMALSGSIQ